MKEHKNILKVVPSEFYPPEIKPEDWKLGAITGIFEKPLTDGHWLPFLPKGERQRNNSLETYGCTAFGVNNRIEILFKFLFDWERNFSDRFTGIISHLRPPGGDPYAIAEAVRKNGLVDEAYLPFTEDIKTIDQFYSPDPPTDDLVTRANQFLTEHTINHDWVNSDHESLKYALQMSPLGIYAKAWYLGSDGLYYFPPQMNPNHDTSLVDFKEGSYWTIFDSYPELNEAVIQANMKEFNLPRDKVLYLKRVKWETEFPFHSKRYQFNEGQDLTPVKNSLINFIKEFISFLQNIVKEKKTENMTSTKIPIWAKAIEKEEFWAPGTRSYRNCNPGNIKASHYTIQFPGEKGVDRDGFLIFDTYDSGFKALCLFLEAAARKQLRPYHIDINGKEFECTLSRFTEIYANPPNDNYVRNVAATLKVGVEELIKNLL